MNGQNDRTEQYQALASVYDELIGDVDYDKWTDFLCDCFDKFSDKKPEIVLDLACGTGEISFRLAERGFDVIGVDLSPEMLDIALAKKAEIKNAKDVQFLNQDMTELDLFGTVDAVVCCLDSINYLKDKNQLKKCFDKVNLFMNDGGLFIFDINTPHKFESFYGNNCFILEDETTYCGWQNYYDKKTGKCDFYLTIFKDNGDGSYSRTDEHQVERRFADRTIQKALTESGFELVGIYSGFDFEQYEKNDDRWYFVARARNKNK